MEFKPPLQLRTGEYLRLSMDIAAASLNFILCLDTEIQGAYHNRWQAPPRVTKVTSPDW